MTKIQNAFANGKAFISFVTAGDPTLDVTEQLIETMEQAGADLIEIGIPFSDPVAEGPVIQAANERALAAGCTTDKIFDMLLRVRKKTQVPLVFLTYLNPIFTYGAQRFLEKCAQCGIDGLIIPDMPFEEKGEIALLCEQYNVDIISMIAPTSHERITKIAKDAAGFLYCVSSLGVTGVRQQIGSNIGEMVASIRSVTDLPCAVGFGIAEPHQAKAMAQIADGAIVGSAIMKIVSEHGKDSAPYIYEYVKQMKQAVSEA